MPGRRRADERLESGGDQDPVLVDERDEVGDGSERDEVEQLARIEARAEAGAQRRRQVERDAAGGEPLEREARRPGRRELMSA